MDAPGATRASPAGEPERGFVDDGCARDVQGGVGRLVVLGERNGVVDHEAGRPQFIDELLLQRRYSLMFEGHRWLDHRRFNRLAQLPLDQPNHFRAKVQPVPQAECLIRVNEATPELRGPGCP